MHHSRRKSGHGSSANASLTDVRKASVTVSTGSPRHKSSSTTPSRASASAMARKSSSQQSTAQKLGKSPKEREKEWEEEHWYEDERESFPQYCMTCEKQVNDGWLYCSEACRRHDQTPSGSTPNVKSFAAASAATYPSSHYPFYDAGVPEPRDIIPRAVPSRPSSTYFGQTTAPSDFTTTSAQRSFSTSSARPPSPPSPTSASSAFWPFSRSAATSPTSSYMRADDSTTAGAYPSTYHVGATSSNYGYAHGYSGMDRPLPSRQGGAYSRPKSIELVTPMIGR